MQAAQQDYAPAMQRIGSCYQHGEGVASSMKTAMEWYEKYLEHCPDSAFEQQLSYFKAIPGLMDDSGMEIQVDLNQVYEPEEFTMDFDFGMGFQADSIAAMVAFSDAETYELELLAQGILSDAPKPESADSLSKEAFPRVLLKAAEGDRRALEILETIDYASGMTLF
ncbi:MAG: sel1 repeat family protein, partial [Oscillospiraceae bacterium]|nr:sel1 repeat family protein [Oscillospiraceae bacterium]